MAYFEPYIDADGIHVPVYGDIIEYLTTQYKAVFGEDVYLGEETPDYQMLSIFAKSLEDYSVLAIESFNARNPNYASGNSLDLLVQLNGMTRRAKTASKCVLTIEGDEGTYIPEGSKAIDDSGNLWTLDSDYEIPEGGTGTIGSTCDTLGAIPAPIGAIYGIYNPVPGWDRVINNVEAEVGLNDETDAELRARFTESHTATTSGTESSIITGLMNIVGVRFVGMEQNSTGSDIPGGLPAHSFCAVVEGGEEEDIAKEILRLKPPGVATYGNKTVSIVDDYGNTNSIKFSRPETITVNITVSVVDLGGYDADRVDEIIKESLKNDINNLGIGKSWNVTMGYKDIYSQVGSNDPKYAIVSITSTDADASGIVQCDYDQVLFTDDEHITISEYGG